MTGPDAPGSGAATAGDSAPARPVLRTADLSGRERYQLLTSLGVRLSEAVRRVEGTQFADTESLRPVARLWGDLYSLVGEMPALSRPKV